MLDNPYFLCLITHTIHYPFFIPHLAHSFLTYISILPNASTWLMESTCNSKDCHKISLLTLSKFEGIDFYSL